jgi:hypothetical protein
MFRTSTPNFLAWICYFKFEVIKTSVSHIIGMGLCKTLATVSLTTLEFGTIWRR